MITNNFTFRHIGPSEEEKQTLLKTIGVSSGEELIEKTIPKSIINPKNLNIGPGLNEYETQSLLKSLGAQNKIFKSFIGMGYYGTIIPGVILRNILESPGWYTSYTPYQAEISQGRLEALLNFQTVVSDLTGMPISNASLLDEATAAAEAMLMTYNTRKRDKVKAGANQFFVSHGILPQSLDVIRTRAIPLGIDVVVDCVKSYNFNEKTFGALVQYPNQYGKIQDYSEFAEKVHANGSMLAVAADLMALTLLTPPAEWGADIVVGSTQRLGIPMGYGGPSAAFMATKEEFVRTMPGRIIGVSKDALGNRALRMTLQTREQHIKRERATSNICTAQALLAIMAGMYAVYHGPDGLKEIARHMNILAGVLSAEVEKVGYKQINENYFDTVQIQIPDGVNMDEIRKLALQNEMNFRYIDSKLIGISIDETTTLDDINTIADLLASAVGKQHTPYVCKPAECELIRTFDAAFDRKSSYLTHKVFHSYRNETDMMRYITNLRNKDLALDRAMIPLGSCTMKLNAATELFYMSWPEYGNIHPFVPADQAKGYLTMLAELEQLLAEITGFDKVSFQPNSGAAGEYTGLMVIRAYHESRGDSARNVCLIPSSAHGTNPASAAMAGMKIVVIKADEKGNIDIADLKQKADEHSKDLSALMITYPSTHGIFEEAVIEIMDIIHSHGGQVYMDGANMNAQVGYTSPGFIGADVCHLNLHKTFAIPHGGGGPGVGPIGVARHLSPFLPGHVMVKTGGEKAISAVAASPFGSAYVIPISYAYIKLLGGEGLKKATEYAILNANYLMKKLEPHYNILYKGDHGFVAHEFIVDCNAFHKDGVTETDIAKRLMDYGFHAPTLGFPVHGTLMVEPTESEPMSELNRFIDAMLAIREEIREVAEGKCDKENNVLKHAPHTVEMVATDNWNKPYSREKATCHRKDALKYWPTVTRIDDAYGDRNIFCTCATPE
ncbi:MAG: glycine dehydrogenase (aminomethyl-transferring) [Bacteroidetes bacterium GWF2_43_63]|nr:MAG: glycine dehydrogenase (aminomethyl-transferring) [Bacteroidetes bacterium GWE2_42_42]OFY55139.1 MAG: glycine dehydrogenase (aminomethyl-transferring) [Bacteroidetes bacterium GWF2_43_63]HBG70241.1 glycine dehydrogenase (aminomethyl-transferring) [Bacteroidales bacterium]HCB63087.1 glycine dehydrogenase (aminomethyl-transferring) [Bacteroidales bacterium]HCY22694.1 glycine dehydrogenase (aminomethyl-transferring) [Bacteroidales bacterium]